MLALWVAAAAVAGSATLPPPCASDAGCAYAGTCAAGVCTCRHPWTGPRCSTLALAPAEPRGGLRLAHNWTWGGSVIKGEDGQFHMFVMALRDHCGIQCVYTNAIIHHAVAAAPQGPFAVRGVALAPRPGHWDADIVSEPTIHRVPDGTYVMYYMGLNDTRSSPIDCMASDQTCLGIRGTRKIGVAWSKSLEGPWERLPAPILGPNPAGSPNCDVHDVSNPAVAFTPNGSAIMAFKGEGPSKGCTSGVTGFATAPHWKGPFTRPFPTSEGSGPQRLGVRACEDPYIWWDRPGGVFRMLSHACLASVNASRGLAAAAGSWATGMGGHFFSRDGLSWHEAWTDNVTTWAYNSTVELTNGSSLNFERRERPQVLLDPQSGELQCLYNAVQPCSATWGDACHSYTLAQCVAPRAKSDDPASHCTIRPGTLPLDTAGNEVHAHGGGVYTEGGYYYLVGTSLKEAVPVNKLQPKSAKVYLSRTINIYRSRTLCNWTLISGSGAFNRSTLEENMPGLSKGETVRMERPKLARATDGSGRYVIWMHAQDGGHGTNSNVAVVHSQKISGPYTWAAAFFADGRISKDSSVFTDTDGRSYFVRDTAHDCDSMSLLSPSGLNTSGICSETGNASQTHNCSGYARAPEGPNGATYLCEGVAMFRDPQDGRLFLLGSHLTGWGANAAMLSVSDSATVCGSHWTYLGNPARGPNAASTYASQSTFVLPYRDPVSNQTTLVAMLDRWSFPNETKATYVWLPMERDPATKAWTFQWHDEWTLGGGGPVAVKNDDAARGRGWRQDVFAISEWQAPRVFAGADWERNAAKRYKEFADANFTVMLGGLQGNVSRGQRACQCSNGTEPCCGHTAEALQMRLCEANRLKCVPGLEYSSGGCNPLRLGPGGCRGKAIRAPLKIDPAAARSSAFWGFDIADEPKAEMFPYLGTVSAQVSSLYPKALRFINLYPDYATAPQLNSTNYSTYVNEFVKLVSPDVIR